MKNNDNRLYKDLAWLWPMWEDVEEYRCESELFAGLIRKYSKIEVKSLLDIGCGGGKFMFHLKRHFAVTGIDISQAMLSNAKKLNPECDFHLADMRNFNLNQQFDTVFIDDSLAYMITKEDLLKVFENAYKHLRTGGVMITYPDVCKETFNQNKTEVSASRAVSKPDNTEITFIVNSYDPNPEDDTYESTFIYLIREDGKLRIEHDFHVCGLFALDVWRKSLRTVGFEVNEEEWRKHAKALPIFACIKPL